MVQKVGCTLPNILNQLGSYIFWASCLHLQYRPFLLVPFLELTSKANWHCDDSVYLVILAVMSFLAYGVDTFILSLKVGMKM